MKNKEKVGIKTIYQHWLLFIFASSLSLLSLTDTLFASNEMNINGFISQGYLKTDANNFLAETKRGTWEYAEVGIQF